jgi:acetyltransferase-like isoleucine patch superfamily enzyme
VPGGSVICFPTATVMNERFIHIGSGTMIGPNVSLSAGMVPGQRCLSERVVSIGDRCLIGRGSGIVGHLEIVIGDDVWTGHFVYITDQNHGYADPTEPISRQTQPERPVHIGSGSWLGHGTVVLPGANIGEHVVVGANSVVTGDIPSFSVAVGAPATHGGLGEGDVLTRSELVRVPVPVLQEDPVLRFPVGNDRLSLLVGGRDGDDVVEHVAEQVGRLVDEIGAHGEIVRRPGVDGSQLRLGRDADPLGPRGPGRVLDLVDRFLGGEEQRPDPEQDEAHDRSPEQDASDR